MKKLGLLTIKFFFVNLIFAMVGKMLSSKYKILQLLRESTAPVSGEEIAKKTGVSRVSVWKAVQTLLSFGYGITTDRAGYFLKEDLQDSLFPWEFGEEENLFSHFKETESTMIEAKKIAENAIDKKTRIVTADSQSNGQGHKGHKWMTTKGSLACTIIMRKKILAPEVQRFTMASQIAIVKVLRENTNKSFFVRWPNDIWTANGKVGGILDDFYATGNLCNWLNLGIGINLHSSPNIAGTDSADLDEKKLSRKNFLNLFLKEFKIQEKIAFEDNSSLVSEWDSLSFDKEKKVILSSDKKEYTFKGISSLGFALLKSNTGETKKIIPGKDNFLKY